MVLQRIRPYMLPLLMLCVSVVAMVRPVDPIECVDARERPRANAFSPSLKRDVDALAHEAMKVQHLAGFSLAIARDGAIIYARGYGYRNLPKRLPATPHTIYNVGSITKQFTATAVMLLQEDGKLQVDDPVGDYVPGLSWGRLVTLRQLLNHTSGVADYLTLINNSALTMPKALAAIRGSRLTFTPGSRYRYSNSNYILLGVVVQKASGMAFDDFLRQRIFRPFGLTATSVGTTPLALPQGATGYTVVKGRTKPVNPKDDSAAELDFPDGAVNTTVLDLVKWDTALDSGRIVKPETLRLMFTPSHHRADWPYGYGFGLGLDRVNGHREIVHEGEWTGFAGENATFPDDSFDIVMLSNTDTFQEDVLKRHIFRLFYPLGS
jgi:CubicO group peptidase (beta-lactamase class C family)